MSWEVALERRVGDRLGVSATYFDQRFRDREQQAMDGLFGRATGESEGASGRNGGSA